MRLKLKLKRPLPLNLLLFFLAAVLAALADFVSKRLAVYFAFSTLNFNSSFSLGAAGFWLNLALFALGVIGVAGVVREMGEIGERWKAWVGLGMIAGGALGNLAEYIFYGAITDFIPLWLPGAGVWAYANLGDFFVWGGVIGLLAVYWSS